MKNRLFVTKRKFILFFLTLYQIIWINPVRRYKMRKVKNYFDLYQVAIWEIDLLSHFGPVRMVSAPLFSGGVGDFQKNLKILERYINYISSDGDIVWNQINYLDVHIKRWSQISVDVSQKIKNFYVPLLQSGKIKTLICVGGMISVPGYADSLGCKTERDSAIQAGVEIQARICLWLH